MRGRGVQVISARLLKEPCWITRDEIAAYRKLQAQFGWKRLGLVSSASHLPHSIKSYFD